MTTLAFLLLVSLGALVQTITGFAMGLIIMGGAALFGLIDLRAAAAVVSLISLMNVAVALRRTYRFVEREFFLSIVLGMIPMIIIGVLLLDYWSGSNYELLKMMLGLVIVSAGVLLFLKPLAYLQRSPRWLNVLVGCASGIMGGLYGAGGAPTAYHLYRQPLLLQAVRATLLGTFAISTIVRSGFVAVQGHITTEVLWLTGLAMPAVVGMTLLGGVLMPRVPELAVRRFAFLLLILLGGSLVVGGLTQMLNLAV